MAFIAETLAKYPTLRASRLYTMVRERGYPGAPDHFRAIVARLRPRPAGEAYLRLRTLPGEQAQVDWAHFGQARHRPCRTSADGLRDGAVVLAARCFLRFYLGASMSYFLRGHVEAFTSFNSLPRVLLYDNLKSAVLERVGDAIRFHPDAAGAWPRTTASSRVQWPRRAATRKAAWSAQSVLHARRSSPGAASVTSMI